jgi:hypothetical protein
MIRGQNRHLATSQWQLRFSHVACKKYLAAVFLLAQSIFPPWQMKDIVFVNSGPWV